MGRPSPALPSWLGANATGCLRPGTPWSPAQRPRLWLTYHPYYKAPDLIGPDIARHFGVAYVTAEASYAGKRDRDAWAELQSAVKKAVRAAAINICFTAADREGLARIVEPASCATWRRSSIPRRFWRLRRNRQAARPGPAGDGRDDARRRQACQLRNAGRALQRIVDVPWTLVVVGDGPQRAQVAAALAKLPRRG
jgi:hypothetical protein